MLDRRRNVVFSLRNRELRNDSSKRTDFNVLKTLIVHSSRKFNKVWSKQSSTMLHYEGGCLFSENFRVCHGGYAINCGLKEKYKKPKPEAYSKNRIEDAMIYQCYHENFHKFDNRASLIGILARQMGESLVQYDLATGELVREIFLSRTVKFKHLSWVESNETFVVKSKHIAARARFHLATGMFMNVAIVMAVFSAFPLKFTGMFEVDRRIFGSGITNAMLSNSLLIVMYITGHVKFFSFPYILEKFKVSDYDIDRAERCLYGGNDEIQYGPSLPINIKITECPPVLFEVKCADHDVQIGGFPWHYIITPYGSEDTFTIHNLRDDKKAKNGALAPAFVKSEPDCCVFHDDNSGRIIHVTSPEIRLMKIHTEEQKEKSELRTVATVSLRQELEKEEVPFQVTSSGRLVRKRQSLEEVDTSADTIIHQVQYEDELDLTFVSATYCHPPDLMGVVRFHDNMTFDLLREIKLPGHSDEIYESVTYVDLDTIVQILKPQLSKYVCTVYRLSGDEQPDQEGSVSADKPHKQSGKMSTPRTSQNRNR